MGKKELGTKREYTEEFKVETVRLAESIQGNAAARRLGAPQSTVTNSVWRHLLCQQVRKPKSAYTRWSGSFYR